MAEMRIKKSIFTVLNNTFSRADLGRNRSFCDKSVKFGTKLPFIMWMRGWGSTVPLITYNKNVRS